MPRAAKLWALLLAVSLLLAGCLQQPEPPERKEGPMEDPAHPRPAILAKRLDPQPRWVTFPPEEVPTIGNGTLLRAMQDATQEAPGAGFGTSGDVSAALRAVHDEWNATHGEWNLSSEPYGPVVRWQGTDFAIARMV